MMVRVLAFCLNARESLSFTKGISTSEEPDIWARSLDDQVSLWVEVGEPDADRIKKATRLASTVKVYSFNSKSGTWWNQGQTKFRALTASFYRFDWENIQALAALVQRTMELSITISGDSAYIAAQAGEVEIPWVTLYESVEK